MSTQTVFRYLLGVTAALFLGFAVAQEVPEQEADDTTDTEASPPDEGEVELTEPGQEIDEEGLDEQGFEAQDDDDFIPTEEISADQSIPFPTDI
ncbi:MAG: hypothetical protein AAGA33_01815 [Pseudomonadota bacterium]